MVALTDILTSQLKEGRGEIIYNLGLGDTSETPGLPDNQLDASVANFTVRARVISFILSLAATQTSIDASSYARRHHHLPAPTTYLPPRDCCWYTSQRCSRAWDCVRPLPGYSLCRFPPLASTLITRPHQSSHTRRSLHMCANLPLSRRPSLTRCTKMCLAYACTTPPLLQHTPSCTYIYTRVLSHIHTHAHQAVCEKMGATLTHIRNREEAGGKASAFLVRSQRDVGAFFPTCWLAEGGGSYRETE